MKQTPHNDLRRFVHALTSLFWSPLKRSENLSGFSRTGFFLFSPFFLVLFFIVFEAVERLVKAKPELAKPSLAVLTFVAGLLSTTPTTLIDAGPIIGGILFFFLLYAVPRLRNSIGLFFANTTISIAKTAMSGAEYLILHRWTSLSALLVVTATLALAVFAFVQEQRSTGSLENDFQHWVRLSEAVVKSTPGDGRDLSRYSQAATLFSPKFSNILQPQTYDKAEAIAATFRCLVDSQPSGRPFRMAASDCAQVIEPLAKHSTIDSNNRLSQLFTIVLVQLRFFSAGDDCHHIDSFDDSLRRLRELQKGEYRALSQHLQGNIYACMAFSSLRADRISTHPSPDCNDIDSCFRQAIEAFYHASDGAPRCGFLDKRCRNNVLDVLVRIAAEFDAFTSLQLRDTEMLQWAAEPTLLADNLDAGSQSLLRCAYTEPVIPTIYFTSGQALAAAADLSSTDSPLVLSRLERSGTLLSIAAAYHPQEAFTWYVEPFCSVLATNDRRTAFSRGFLLLPGSPQDWLTDFYRVLQSKCR